MKRTKYHEGPHKYVKKIFKSSGTEIFKCVKSCPHFVYEAQIVGREAQCFRCERAFTVMEKTLKTKKLHCEDCTRLRYNKPKPKTEQVVGMLTNSGEDLIDVDALLQESHELLNKGGGI